MITDQNLLWLDLEMTGLNPDRDVILEIATLVTNNELNIIARGPQIAIHHSEEILEMMDTWNTDQHTKSGLIDEVRKAALNTRDAEVETLEFVRKYCKPQTAPLCGNSIYQDRAFLRKWMAELNAFTHYRLIDVSTIKELVRRWFPTNPHAFFDKEKIAAHRAMKDVEAAIEELLFYKKYFFIEPVAE